jgi:hypothetical protein
MWANLNGLVLKCGPKVVSQSLGRKIAKRPNTIRWVPRYIDFASCIDGIVGRDSFNVLGCNGIVASLVSRGRFAFAVSAIPECLIERQPVGCISEVHSYRADLVEGVVDSNWGEDSRSRSH